MAHLLASLVLPASKGGEGQALHSVDRRFDSNGMQRGV